jgi:succinyl-diaminopimelate desuccinylase
MNKSLELTKKLINRKSITPNDNGCQEVIQNELSALGFKFSKYDSKDVKNLYGEMGNSKPLIVFAGHTDVVPTGPIDQWKFNPFEATEENGLLYGRGAADMKASLAAFVVSIQEFVNSNPAFNGSIGILITSDEEGIATDGTTIVVKEFLKNKKRFDFCIVGEPTCATNFGDTIKNGRRGSLSATLSIKGVQGHIAYPHLIDNPIHRLASIIDELKKIEWDNGNKYFPKTSWQVSNIEAGTGATNVVPGLAVAKFNFRHSTECTPESLKRDLEMIVKKHAVEFEIDWENPSEPYITEEGKLITALKSSIKEITNINADVSTTGGTSDGRFIAKISDEVVEFGPINSSIHKINEHVNIKNIEQLKNIYLRTLEKILL